MRVVINIKVNQNIKKQMNLPEFVANLPRQVMFVYVWSAAKSISTQKE